MNSRTAAKPDPPPISNASLASENCPARKADLMSGLMSGPPPMTASYRVGRRNFGAQGSIHSRLSPLSGSGRLAPLFGRGAPSSVPTGQKPSSWCGPWSIRLSPIWGRPCGAIRFRFAEAINRQRRQRGWWSACGLRLLRSREAPSWSNSSLRELFRCW